MRNASDAEEVEVGWWPGDERYPQAAFYAYAIPRPRGSRTRRSRPRRRAGTPTLGEFILDWDDVRDDPDPHASALAVRALRRASCVRGVRLGSGAGGQRRGHSAARRLRPYTALMPDTVCPAGHVHV